MLVKNRILVIDDHPLLREGVVSILAAQEDFVVLGEGASYSDALHRSQNLSPNIVLLDITIPGGGVEAARDIHTLMPAIKIIMLTGSEDEADVMTAFQVGASAYILKGISGKELVSIVRRVSSGETYITQSLATAILGQKPDPSLSWLEKLNTREKEVLNLLGHGYTNKKIAETLFLSEKTIKHYASNIFQKLQVSNRLEAGLMAKKIGVIH